jgi:hypothetical protein
LLIFAAYTLYVISIGGDVLQAHRFFVPVLFFLFFPLTDSLYQVTQIRWNGRTVFAAGILLVDVYHYAAPRSYLESTGHLQNVSVTKMTQAARFLDRDSSIRSVAATAIGALSYYLGDRRILDMLGLVDTMVARHPEKIEGLVSTWRERNFNAGYILSQKPDVVLFSTGIKPSALAERALFLYPDFRRNYRLEFAFQSDNFAMYYRRFKNPSENEAPDIPARFANLFNEAINFIVVRKQPAEGIKLLHRLLNEGPKDCPTFYTALGYAYLSVPSSPPESTEFYLKKGMEFDGAGSISRLYMGYFFVQQQKFEAASEQFSILAQTVPNAAEFLQKSNLLPSSNY